MRGRCLTLLLAFVAWFMVPAAPRVATSPGGPAIHHIATHGSPATVERASDRSDRRVRPELGSDVLPGSTFDLPVVAAAPAVSSSPELDTPFVPRIHSSAQPRGPPVA